MYFFIVSVVALLGAITAEDRVTLVYNELMGTRAVETTFGLTQINSFPCSINKYKFDFVCHLKDDETKTVLSIFNTGNENDVIQGECVLMSSEDTVTLIDALAARGYTATEGITATYYDENNNSLEIPSVIYEAVTTTCPEEGAIPEKSLWNKLVCAELLMGYYEQIINILFLKTAVLNDDDVPVTFCSAA